MAEEEEKHVMLKIDSEEIPKFTLIGGKYIIQFSSWDAFVDFLLDILKVIEKHSDKIEVFEK